MNKNYIYQVLKFSINISFPTILLLFFILAYVSSLQDETELLLLKSSMTSRMNILQHLITHDFSSVTSDLQILAESEILQDFILDESKNNYRNLATFFLSYSKRKELYDQIRFLDMNGMEKVRVNFNSGKPTSVGIEDLQNKQKRYYFKNVFELNEREIFVSPMDLNIENGEVERPLKPMIRFGMPVFDKNKEKKGIILLNYFGETILSTIKQYTDFDGTGVLLNSSGYWLLSPNIDETWGFMFDDKLDRKFDKDFPNEWDSLIVKDAGQFSTDNGLYTFETIYPIEEAWKSSHGSGIPYGPCDYLKEGEKYFWKLLLYYPRENIVSRHSHRENTNILFVLISLFIFVLSVFLSRAIVKRKAAEEKQKKTLETLKISQKKLLKDSAEKDKFFSIISHDLRSPFQGIMGFGNMLASNHSDFTKEELNESLQILNNSLINVYNLLDGLLEWSRIQTGRIKINPEVLNVEKISKSIIDLLSLNASKKEIVLKNNVDTNINVFTDRKLFETVLRNLIANAIKFTNLNGIIKVYSKIIGSKFQIIVEDNGVGISQDNIEKLFKLDVHHTTKGTNREQGTGLGLILCKDLLERVEGKIEVESKIGEGSKFIVTLSLYKERNNNLDKET